MIVRPAAQAAAPAVRPLASAQPPVPGAGSAAVPAVELPPAAREPAASDEIRSRTRGEPRASPPAPTGKYRTVFACATHARDAPTEEQRS